jgi:NAD(P)-dependent dehydrogenase (short-subunit alcohol dehydrogenase family)
MSNTEKYHPKITPVSDRLLGKVALITGGASGIGRAIALRFAQEGADIAIADINPEYGGNTAAEIRRLGRACISVPTDVSDRSQVEDLVHSVLKEYGAIDILVNNAGVIVFGDLMTCRMDDWDKMLAVDLTGALHCAQIVGKHMIVRNQGGRLIHIGSTASLLPTARQGAYCVAKAGLGMLSKMAAMELAPYGITSNLLCPEGAVTDLNRILFSDPSVMAALESKIPLGRMAATEEIAAAAAFLASDEAAYITGTDLIHDGGITASALWWR